MRRRRKGKKSAAGYRVSKGGSVYRVKGKTSSGRKTYKKKSAARKAAKRRR